MLKKFSDYLAQVRRYPDGPSAEPDLDKVQKEHIKQFRETEALSSGAVREAILEQGYGEGTPKEGDLVYVHYSVVNDVEEVQYSTLSDAGGCGAPLAFILGKAPRVPRGWEVALLEMKRGERRALRIRPDFAFLYSECTYHLPTHLRDLESDELMFDLRLVNWYPSSDVSRVMGTQQVLKCMLSEGQGWENPRPPYEVVFSCVARIPNSDGVQCTGHAYFQTEAPMEVCMGKNQIPEGVEAALGCMVKQERSVFIVPRELMQCSSECAFPEPPGQVEQVELEIHLKTVLQVRDMLGDGKVLKRRLRDGTGEFPIDCPVEDCKVRLHFRARKACESPSKQGQDAAEWVFDSRSEGSQPLEVDLGCGLLPEGVEAAVRLMLPNELALVHCHPEAAYASQPEAAPSGVPPYGYVEFEVELMGFKRDSELRDQSAEDCVRSGQAMKEIANNLYKEKKYKLASIKYQKVVRMIDATRHFETEADIRAADELKLLCQGNLALCCLAEDDFSGAVEWCNKALKIDDENTKILLRRGKALSLRGDHEHAELDFLRAKELDPSLSQEVDAAVLRNKQRLRAALQKQKKEFTNFFGKS